MRRQTSDKWNHMYVMEENYSHVPTGLKESLKHCGVLAESKILIRIATQKSYTQLL